MAVSADLDHGGEVARHPGHIALTSVYVEAALLCLMGGGAAAQCLRVTSDRMGDFTCQYVYAAAPCAQQ